MKLANILPMPVSVPSATSSAPPTMPKPLQTALQTAEALLSERANLTEHLSEQTAALPTLLREKLDLESNLAHVRTGALLSEATDVDVQAAVDSLSSAERDYKAANGIRKSLQSRLLDQEPALTECKAGIVAHLPDYAVRVVEEFETEYRAAVEQFSTLLARGQSISYALKVPVNMPAPMVASTPQTAMSAGEMGETGDIDRVAKTLDALEAALHSVAGERQQMARERNRRIAFAPGLVWELLKDSPPFRAGDWIEAPLVPEHALERLFLTKSVRPVTDAELSRDHDAATAEFA